MRAAFTAPGALSVKEYLRSPGTRLETASVTAVRCNMSTPKEPLRPARVAPVLLTDVMDTVVIDPFFRSMAGHFSFDSFEEFLSAKKDGTWLQFELGQIGEDVVAKEFFADPSRKFDMKAFKEYLLDSYEFVPGMDDLLRRYIERGIEVHAFSNYPIWFTLIEQKLRLQREYGVRWSFVSACEGIRKPDEASYKRAARNANADIGDCILLDDRESNCSGAIEAGFLAAVHFENAEQAARDLDTVFAKFVPRTA